MRDWAHHHRTDTVDDPVFRAAMQGYDSVSFVFSLEVTWSKIQQRQQEEEDQKALEELQAMQELQESNGEKEDCDEEDKESDSIEKIEILDERGENNKNEGTQNTSEAVKEDPLEDSDEEEPAEDEEGADEPASSPVDLEDPAVESTGSGNVEDDVASSQMDVEGSDDGNQGNQEDSENGEDSFIVESDEEQVEQLGPASMGSSDDEAIVASVTEDASSPSAGSSSGSDSDSCANASSPARSILSSTQDAEIVMTSQDESPTTSANKSKEWACSACTFANPRAKRKCGACGTSRPKTCDSSACNRRGTKRSRGSR